MKITLNVVLFNYLDRPIFDVCVDGKVGESSSAYPSTGSGMITGVSLSLGPKKVTWRLDGPKGMSRNGEVVSNKNPLTLDDVMPGAKFLGVHIYPDETVDLIASVRVPRKTERGLEIRESLVTHRG